MSQRKVIRDRRAVVESFETRRLLSTVVALTANDQLVSFDTASPGTVSAPVTISGLQASESLVGLDYRPATGQLYGIGSTGRVYTVSATTGTATEVGAGPATTLDGTRFGVDFNPQVDRIRVVSNTEQNLRLNPVNGTLVATDSPLAYATGDVAAGANPNVVSAAYSNNVPSATTTTLYVIDAARDTLVTQGSGPGATSVVSPNTGQLFTVGTLGIDTGDLVGFDVAGDTGTAYASLTPAGASVSALHTINLTTGAATAVGDIGGGAAIKDIAVVPTLPTLFALGSNGTSFVTFSPGSLATPSAPVDVTGLQASETLVGIDFRPATGQLYGLGSTGRLYTINLTTGAGTAVGTGTLDPALSGTSFGVDFNPAADRLRVVSDADQNLRIDPNTGAAVDGDPNTPGVQSDAPLAYAAGDPGFGANPNVSDIAYNNNVAGAAGTALFGIDVDRDVLVLQGSAPGVTPAVSPNTGQLTTVGALGVDVASSGFDIAPGSPGAAYLLVNAVGGTGSQLYSVNLGTGGLTLIGTVGDGTSTFSDLAVGLSVFAFAPATATVAESAGNVTLTVTRTGLTTGAATVDFAVPAQGGGTATPGVDFGTASGTLSFAANETSKTITIPIIDDSIIEVDETFVVQLSGSSPGAQVGAPGAATVTITDNDVAGAAQAADPVVTNRNIVVVRGTAGDDTILVRRGARNQIDVLLNGVSQGLFSARTYRIVVYAGAGDDDVRIAPNVNVSAELHGQDGNDVLVGSRNRDLLVGGSGTDALYGRAGDDILIAGTTTYEDNPNATASIMQRWLGRGSFAQRAGAVSSGTGVTGSFAFSSATIQNDTVRDYLAGEGANDLSFVSAKDAIADDVLRGRATPV